MNINFSNVTFEEVGTTNLEAIVLAPSGGGKSHLVGSLDRTVLYLYGSDETHGKTSASGGKATIKALQWDRNPETGEQLNADDALAFILAVLTDEFLDAYGIDAIVLDSMTSLEKLIKSSSRFKVMCQTKDGGHNTFVEGEKAQIIVDEILSTVRKLSAKRKLDLVVTCVVDVKDKDEETGAYSIVRPRLSSYGLAESTIQQFPQVLLIGKVQIKDKKGHCFQFDTLIERVSKDQNGNVKKYLNFDPRVIGSKRDLKRFEKADLEEIRTLLVD
jgi:hypothetical protein